jgi:hypothetical protein
MSRVLIRVVLFRITGIVFGLVSPLPGAGR